MFLRFKVGSLVVMLLMSLDVMFAYAYVCIRDDDVDDSLNNQITIYGNRTDVEILIINNRQKPYV